MSRLIVNFEICPCCGDVITRLALVSQSKVNVVHVNFQVVSNSCLIVTLITLVHDSLVDLSDVSLQVAEQIRAVLTFFTLERLGNQRHYEASTFNSRLEELRINDNSAGVQCRLLGPWSAGESRRDTVVLVLLKLHLGEGGEGTLVIEVFLAVTEVFTLLLEVSVFLSLVLVEGRVPGGGPVTQLALHPSLLVLRPGVGVEVGQVVGPVLAVLAGEDMLTRVNLLVVSQSQSPVNKAGPALTM